MKKILLSLLLIAGLSVSALANDIQQSTSSTPLLFFCKDSAGEPITGLSPTVTISKNGGSFGSPAGSVSEIGSIGVYKVAGNATDTNTLGTIYLKAVCSGGVTFLFPVATVVDIPSLQDVVDGILDEALSGHTTSGTTGKAIGDTNTNVTAINGAVILHSGTAQDGTSTTITLDAGAIATSGYYAGAVVIVKSGTGAGQVRTIQSYVGSTRVATVNRAWATNPTSSSVFSVVIP